jgi:hypothetical protein
MINKKDIINLIDKYNDAEIELYKLKNNNTNTTIPYYNQYNITALEISNNSCTTLSEIGILQNYIKQLKDHMIRLIQDN